MQSGHFSQCTAFLSPTAKERDKKYSVNRRSGTKSKIPSTFCPALLKSAKQIVNKHSFSFNHQTDQGKKTEGFEREGFEREG
jgi:hypothetical protein